MTRFVLLAREGCHLCEAFAQELRAVFPPEQVELEHADVDSRADWRRRWGLKIPVLLSTDGALVCATRFEAAALRPFLGD